MRILVVEDEYKLAELIKVRLERENYLVDMIHDGLSGVDMALSGIYDLILLDVMLPNMDGFSILREIRDNKLDTKVIMITAKDTIDSKLEGFNYGCNDYLTKPFHMEELVARVKVVLKDDNSDYDKLVYEDIELNLRTTELKSTRTGYKTQVICKEFQILEILLKNKNQVVLKEVLYDKVWGMDNDSISNNLEAYISFIRKKLKVIGSCVNIKSIRGIGYRLEVIDEEVKK